MVVMTAVVFMAANEEVVQVHCRGCISIDFPWLYHRQTATTIDKVSQQREFNSNTVDGKSNVQIARRKGEACLTMLQS
jgi:hypothetical protein